MKINPCPFCNEAAEVVNNYNCYYVQCTNPKCRAYTLARILNLFDAKETEEEIIESVIRKWNCRNEIIGLEREF